MSICRTRLQVGLAKEGQRLQEDHGKLFSSTRIIWSVASSLSSSSQSHAVSSLSFSCVIVILILVLSPFLLIFLSKFPPFSATMDKGLLLGDLLSILARRRNLHIHSFHTHCPQCCARAKDDMLILLTHLYHSARLCPLFLIPKFHRNGS